jgi:hypothetical protein
VPNILMRQNRQITGLFTTKSPVSDEETGPD